MDSKDLVWKAAIKLLSMKDYSKSELKNKLLKKFVEGDINSVLNKLESMKYIVDTGTDLERMKKMAQEYIAVKKDAVGKLPSLKSLGSYLLKKGFEPELIESFLMNNQEEIFLK